MTTRNALAALACAVLVLLGPAGGWAQTASGLPTGQEESGALRVKTDITGVQIVLDGVEKGTTPTTVRGLAPGPHRLALVKDGYEVHEQAVTIAAGKTELVVVAMKPLILPPPKLPAVFRALHLHAGGVVIHIKPPERALRQSCAGTLTVTADTIEYVDDKKEHVFRVPIRTLRSVSRSFGRAAGVFEQLPNYMMTCRVETPDQFLGFWAVEKGPEDAVEVVMAKTKELFEIVYRLWTDTLKQPGK